MTIETILSSTFTMLYDGDTHCRSGGAMDVCWCRAEKTGVAAWNHPFKRMARVAIGASICFGHGIRLLFAILSSFLLLFVFSWLGTPGVTM